MSREDWEVFDIIKAERQAPGAVALIQCQSAGCFAKNTFPKETPND